MKNKLVENNINMYIYLSFNLLMVLEKQTFLEKFTICIAQETNKIKQNNYMEGSGSATIK